MFIGFVVKVLAAASKDPDIQKFVDDRIDRLKDRLLPDLLAGVAGLLPGFGGSILKTFIGRVPSLQDVDNLPEVTREVAGNIIDTMPDPDIPGVSDAFEKATGIDVSERIKDVLRGFLR